MAPTAAYIHFYPGYGAGNDPAAATAAAAAHAHAEPAVLEVSEADYVDSPTAGAARGDGGASNAEAEAVSEWLAYTTVLLAQADDSVALEGVAVADFEAEAD
eukprot:6424178-Prymnesium_polylepis.1